MIAKSSNDVTPVNDKKPAAAEHAPSLALGRVLINRKQLRQKIPVCDRTVLEMEKRGEFPRRFFIGQKVVWDLVEVDAWIAQRQQAAHARRPSDHSQASSQGSTN